jgi:hypothetical protein
MYEFPILVLAFCLGFLFGIVVMCLCLVVAKPEVFTPAMYFARFGGAVAWRGRPYNPNGSIRRGSHWQYVETSADVFPEHFEVQALGVICNVKDLNEDAYRNAA